MLTIPETTSENGFVVPAFFDRTERFRDRIVDCNREELIDLSFALLGQLEHIQGMMQKENDQLENWLGYHEPLTGRRS